VDSGGGRPRRAAPLTKREAIIKQLVNQSAIADWRAQRQRLSEK
jgi:DNA-binding CsgD family transcriptional regulator